jgi:hypothetical protein
MVSLQDIRLEKHPKCDKIIRNTDHEAYPYFRADSFLGSLYIQDTGVYNIQVISEKIRPKGFNAASVSEADFSKLVSVSFTPVTR